jgi:hypothetical protein
MVLTLFGASTAPGQDDFGYASKQIETWIKAGSAAGNKGDFYDNRDGGHSLLPISRLTDLQQIQYAKEDVRRKGWALQTRVLPDVTFGNSSTSAPPTKSGSHIRTAYTIPSLLGILYQQYTKNNIYVYPEHMDHDGGHNGPNGYGDLMPLNTPYLIGTQGSSGSDQPVLHAIGVTLASFQPATKKKLIETGLLMPTVQVMFRSTQAGIATKADYLSGQAHPTVFDPRNVRCVPLANMAHGLKPADIPAMVQLKVLEEDLPQNGVDYFEPGLGEKLADSPAAIGRIVRGRQYVRRMVVSAEDSYDVNARQRTFHWVVLRGDPARIKIVPRNPRQSIVELTVPYHARAPIRSNPTVESNRVDIGVFIDNGRLISAPGFICFYSLDNERRRYDGQGNILEIDYTTGNFVDARLTASKPWRDVYQYHAGKSTGWTRHYSDGRREQYADDGRLLRPEAGGQPVAVAVEYRLEADPKSPVPILRAIPRP